MTTELYKKYRPRKLSQIMGQPQAVAALEVMVQENRVPHTLLLSGPSGTGKTTIARILRKYLGCSKVDFTEVNCSDLTGIDTVRDIRRRVGQAPLNGTSRIWLIDEAHKITDAAQNAMLKLLEDTPDHVWFILATTNPDKLLRTVRSRCTEISLNSLNSAALEAIIHRVATKENVTLSKAVMEKLIQTADGNGRKALVILDQIRGLPEQDQLDAIVPDKAQTQAIEIFLAIIRREKWSKVAAILREVEDEPERIRRLILACARTSLLKGGRNANQAFLVIEIFGDNFFYSGAAGLAAACYDAVRSTK
ncbi:MAG: AAA family ATPase [Deltaproteobacteria bacterium]|nr:AAA family ATPase [Deltaproteobacteria bacterium]